MATISFDEKVVVTDPEMVEKMKRDIEGGSMERLTYKNGNGEWCVKNNHHCAIATCSNDDGKYYIGEPIDRLAELEDKIENGTLVEIPCIRQTHNHKGQIVYRVYFLDRYWNAIRYYEAKDEAEAEKRLEELKK